MLKILHTADWHLGYVTQQLEREDPIKLSRARLDVVAKILGVAHQQAVHAVLCAGDLFDTSKPDRDCWEGLLKTLRGSPLRCPILLLPGNHDPLIAGSVYAETHPFRRGLPEHVHVIDKRGFEFPLRDHQAVILASPCTSTAGDTDLALTLPRRELGDLDIRIGLVHGSTFDIEGYQTNFPIAKDAARQRGLDYLAIGDTHALREIEPGVFAPTFYPGAPEATRFDERDTGWVLIVTFTKTGVRPRIHKERVAQWTWREELVKSMAALRTLAAEDLRKTVLRLRLDLEIGLTEKPELDSIIEQLRGSVTAHPLAGAIVVDRTRLRLNAEQGALPVHLPETIREAEARLKQDATDQTARDALVLLHRLAREFLT